MITTEIVRAMIRDDGHVEVLRGPTENYISVCRPDGTALLEGLLPAETLDDLLAASLVKQDGPENEYKVTTYRPTEDARAKFT